MLLKDIRTLILVMNRNILFMAIIPSRQITPLNIYRKINLS